METGWGLILDCAGAALRGWGWGPGWVLLPERTLRNHRITAVFKESLGGQGHFLSVRLVPNPQSPSDPLWGSIPHWGAGRGMLGLWECFSKAFVRNTTKLGICLS